MVLERECQQKMEEKFYPIEEEKEDGSLLSQTKYLKSNKRFIIKSKWEISNIFKNGMILYTKDLKIIYLDNKYNHFRFVPCVSKKWGKSFLRNRYKRLIREAMWLNIKSFKEIPYDLVILPNSNQIKNKDYTIKNILPQFNYLIKKLKQIIQG